MPYISKIRRDEMFEGDPTPLTVGELNFLLTMVVKEYLNSKGLSYSTINDIMGALEGAKLEFYRRVAGPYENNKITENGDIY